VFRSRPLRRPRPPSSGANASSFANRERSPCGDPRAHEHRLDAVTGLFAGADERTARPPRRPRGQDRPLRPARAICRSGSSGGGETTVCEAVHPGYGFLSSRRTPTSSGRARNDLSSSARPRWMERIGLTRRSELECSRRDGPARAGHRRTASRRGVASQPASSANPPVLLKAAAVGGGRGMRLVTAPTSSTAPTHRLFRITEAGSLRTARSRSRSDHAAVHVEIHTGDGAMRTHRAGSAASASARIQRRIRTDSKSRRRLRSTPELRRDGGNVERACVPPLLPQNRGTSSSSWARTAFVSVIDDAAAGRSSGDGARHHR